MENRNIDTPFAKTLLWTVAISMVLLMIGCIKGCHDRQSIGWEKDRQEANNYAYELGKRTAKSGGGAEGNPYHQVNHSQNGHALWWNEGWIAGKQEHEKEIKDRPKGMGR